MTSQPKQHSQMGPSRAHPGPIWGPTLPNRGPTGAHMECCLGGSVPKSETIMNIITFLKQYKLFYPKYIKFKTHSVINAIKTLFECMLPSACDVTAWYSVLQHWNGTE